MQRNLALLSFLVLPLLAIDMGTSHAEKPPTDGPRIVAAKEVTASRRQPPKLLLEPPRPAQLARLEGIESYRFSPAGPAIPLAAGQATDWHLARSWGVMPVIESSKRWVRVLLEEDDVTLAVYLDAAVVRTVMVRHTYLVPSRQDLERAGKPGVPGVRLSIGNIVDVLQTRGKVARVRHQHFDFEATGFVHRRDLGKTHPEPDEWGDDRNMCGRDVEPDRFLRMGAKLHDQPGGSAFLEIGERPFGSRIEVTVLDRRQGHALVCNHAFIAWADEADLQPYQDQGRGLGLGLLGDRVEGPPHPTTDGVEQARLPARTYFHDRPGGDVVGYASREIARPIGNAKPGDWVQTRLSTRLGEMSVWFQVPR